MADPQYQEPQAQNPQQAPVVAAGDNRFTPIIAELKKGFPTYSTERILVVDATAQKMILVEQGKAVGEWVISTAINGLGSEKGSDKTPLGVHRIAEKIGAGAPFGAIFKSRQNTGKIVDILTAPGADSPDDYVTSRIMWLDGLEENNRTSKERFIYIHGTGEEGRLGAPASHGCIRMRNKDVIDLFDRVDENTLVVITQQKQSDK
jgi:lipoprotein-anchoring transpeptidase ErfK/SrfK